MIGWAMAHPTKSALLMSGHYAAQSMANEKDIALLKGKGKSQVARIYPQDGWHKITSFN